MLPVPAQPDAFLQVIHAEQVIFPLLVDHAQHDHALVMAHGLRADEFFFGVVALFELFENRVAEFLPVQIVGLHAFGNKIDAEAGEYRVFQALDIPVRGVRLGRAIFFHQLGENRRNIILQDQIFLIGPFEQATAQAIDRLALLVHHVVILDQMFARFEVLAFHRLLRGLDAAGNHLGLDRHALFHPQLLQQGRDPFLGENAHQVIFERKIEARRSRIALASGAPTQLIVNAPRLMPFRAENVQAADRGHFVVLRISLHFVAVERLGPRVGRDRVLVAVVVEDGSDAIFLRPFDLSLGHAQLLRDSLLHQFLLGHELGIAAEQDVSTAASHVGRDRDHALAPGLGDEFGFAFVKLGVQHDVLDAFFLEQVRQPL